MDAATQAEGLLKQGKPREALKLVVEAVKGAPGDDKLRMFLYQISAVLGDYERALAQVSIAAEMRAMHLLPAQLARLAIQGEAMRAEVFAGKRLPMVFGEPPAWISGLLQACQHSSNGQHAAAAKLRELALEAAPALPGRLNGKAFEWLMDADVRFGPCLEAFIDGGYYWVPLESVVHVRTEVPATLSELVWLPSTFTLANGGTVNAQLPVRYPGTEKGGDEGMLMSRKTDWREVAPTTLLGVTCGWGQRLLATESQDIGLLEVREIAVGDGQPSDEDGVSGGGGEGADHA